MAKNISRRDFLKLAGALSLASQLPQFLIEPEPSKRANGSPNILILVFDAFSARHISLYGYDRETTPHLARLAERGTVYHNHYASGNFTYPGTASLLTGTYPWKHRGFNPDNGIDPAYKTKNIFSLFDGFYRISYTHNLVAHNLLRQMQKQIDHLKPRQELYLDHDIISSVLFQNDEDTATISWWQSFVKNGGKSTYSLYLSHLFNYFKEKKITQYKDLYPLGVPNIRDDNFFLPETAIDWTLEQISTIQQPYLGYFHYLPPHDPYLTRQEFYDTFQDDGFRPIKKRNHVFSQFRSYKNLLHDRKAYDEFILLVDAEFGRMFDQMEDTGQLDNTWVIMTSDHGEMFERGIEKHYHPALHQPVIQVPMLVFEPGQKARNDIFDPTSAVDILPTMLHLTGQDIPGWIEGNILPPYKAYAPGDEPSVYALEAKDSKKYGEITPASAMIVKGEYKLTYYYGYKQLEESGPLIELFNIQNDPEELEDLTSTHPNIANQLLEELKIKLKISE
jgi:arylsulfatase A-like enzyme